MDINFSKQCRCFALMLYVDQIGHRKENLTNEEQIKILRDYLNGLELKNIKFYAIVHHKELTNNFDTDLKDKEEKPHIHMIFRSNYSIRPSTVFKMIGVEINDSDKSLYSKKGFYYLNTKRHDEVSSIVYLTHETDNAKLELKPLYNRNEIVTNDSAGYIDKCYEDYQTYFGGLRINKKGKVNSLEEQNILFDYLDEVSKLGYELGDLNEYVDNIPRRYKYKYEDKISNAYFKGVQRRIQNNDRLDVNRVSIYIYGEAGTGKSYGALHTLEDMGRKYYQVTASSGTGGEDDVMPNQCLVYDDRLPANCLDKADDRICRTYRRNRNNGVFSGDFFIINHNKSFDDAFKDWFKNKNENDDKLSEVVKAMKTRFFILNVKNGEVIVEQMNSRLSDFYAEKEKKFMEFKAIFEKYIKDHYDRHLLTPASKKDEDKHIDTSVSDENEDKYVDTSASEDKYDEF